MRDLEPPVVIGSHLDSVPQGGNFDGLAGVVAGLLVLDRAASGRARTGAAPARVLALRGRGECLVRQGLYGLAGPCRPAARLAPWPCPIAAGTRHPRRGHGQAAASMSMRSRGAKRLLRPRRDRRLSRTPYRAGAGDDRAGQWPSAVVTGIRGNIRRHRIRRAVGEAGHSGAVPRWLRKDALLAVAELLSRHGRALARAAPDGRRPRDDGGHPRHRHPYNRTPSRSSQAK